MFRAPWTLVAICVVLIGLYALQSAYLSNQELARLALTPAALEEGRWSTLFTALFLHASWAHVLLNSLAVIAFGPPVARLMGVGARGSLAFFAFYLVCGVLAGLGYVAVQPHDAAPVVGASGAVSGLLGGASRLIQRGGRLGPLLSSTVIGMGAAWVIVNVAMGVSGLTPGAAGVQVAWQAHLAGYAAGVLLVGAFARLAGADPAAFTQ
ncbi:MAG: rhomboid family intramembrane serine protease [Caulobacteraceae bacterium]